jgi:hypothetical protein
MARIQTVERKSGRSYKAYWRDPSGKQRTKTFRRKDAARRFVVQVEAY